MRNTFYELSNTLSRDERQRLVDKIQKSLQKNDVKDEQFLIHKLPGSERRRLQEDHFKRASLIDRIIIWFKGLFSRRRRSELYQDMQLQRIKKDVNRHYSDYFRLGEDVMLPGFAYELFELYKAYTPLISFFDSLWKSDGFLEDVVSSLIGLKVPNVKAGIFDFADLNTMRQEYLKDYKKQDIAKLLEKNINQYLKDIPVELFSELSNGFLPLFYLKPLHTFAFNEIFAHFKSPVRVDEKPQFKAATLSSAMLWIESLHFCLFTISKISKNFDVHEEVYEFYSREHDGVTVESLKSDIKHLVDQAKIFKNKIPIHRIISYKNNDPYYKIMAYLPDIDLKSFYSASLEIRIFDQFDTYFPDFRQTVLNEQIQEVLGTDNIGNFRYYANFETASIKQNGLPVFTYIKTLRILYYFLENIYANSFQPLIHLLNRVIPARKREAQSRLLVQAAGLEDLVDKIADIDYSYSPETEDGKEFMQNKSLLDKELPRQRFYRNHVTQKNKDIKVLILKSIEHFEEILRIFNELANLSESTMNEHFKTFAPQSMQKKSLTKHFASAIELLRKLIRLIQLAQYIEEGR